MEKSVSFLIVISLIFAWFDGYNCYDNVDYEIFDLVEELNQTFYKLFDVTEEAKTSEIKKAYRRLAVRYHPDKNKDEGAEDLFRQIAAIYDILKDDDKRQRYDLVLEHGLPDWRQPVFYFRRVRKLGLLELTIILTIIINGGHVILMWVTYIERKYVQEEIFWSRQRKVRGGRKQQSEEKTLELERELELEFSTIHRPSWRDLIPCKLVSCIIAMVTHIITMPARHREHKEKLEEEKRLEQLEIEEEQERIDYLKKLQEANKNRKRVNLDELRGQMISTPAASEEPLVDRVSPDDSIDDFDKAPKKTGPWLDDDIALLAKALVKFPGGSSQRWQKVARMTGRSVKEVTIMSRNMKQDFARTVNTKAQGITGSLTEVQQVDVLNNYSDISERSWDDEPAVIATGEIAVRRRKKQPINGNASSNSGESQICDKSNTESRSAAAGASATGVRASSGVTWSQDQQKLLELALVQYPRGTDNRWGVISETIPGKTKEECLIRFKHLADMVKRKKVQSSS